jgi:hypothetical protein
MHLGPTYYWQIISEDRQGLTTSGPIWSFTTQDEPNDPPGAPTIIGPSSGPPGELLTFTFNAEDPDGDNVRFLIDWGDGKSDTTDFVPSGDDKDVVHMWDDRDTFTIVVRAEDTFGNIGPETTGQIPICKNKAFNSLFLNFLKNYPNLFPILQRLLQGLGL